MSFVWNLPLFMIIGSLFLAALTVLLKKNALIISEAWIGVLILMDIMLIRHTALNGSFTYSMGEFPAPWGNEIRAGALECLVLLAFLIVILFSMIGGRRYIKDEIEDSKENLYFVLLDLLVAAVCALVFTNDIFSGYVFLEILTMASCGLMIVREVGKTTLAAIRYMVINLFGSGFFLLGVILLYSMTGHLLMVPLSEALELLAQNPEMKLSLAFSLGVMTLGLAIKSGLFPFCFWMPDTYGWSTPTTASIMSSVVSKAYIFLLIKIYYRVVGPKLLVELPIQTILLVLGICAMIIGSLAAIRENNINRMVALSSAAQIGYIFMALGMGFDSAYAAAIFHLIAHSVTKSLLFLTTPRLAEVSNGSLVFHDLQGSGLKRPLEGIVFTACAFSMVGIPIFAGFSSKLFITVAASDANSKIVFYAVVCALAISAVLNALYFVRTVIRIFSRPEGDAEITTVKSELDYAVSSIGLLGSNVLLGVAPMIVFELITLGILQLR